jgi:predicted ATPase
MDEATEKQNSDLTWEDVKAVAKMVGVEIEMTKQRTRDGRAIYFVRAGIHAPPVFLADPKSAMDEVQLIATRGPHRWTMTAEL